MRADGLVVEGRVGVSNCVFRVGRLGVDISVVGERVKESFCLNFSGETSELLSTVFFWVDDILVEM